MKGIPYEMIRDKKAWAFNNGEWSTVDDIVEQVLRVDNNKRGLGPRDIYFVAGYEPASTKKIGLKDTPLVEFELYKKSFLDEYKGIIVEEPEYPYLLEVTFSENVMFMDAIGKIYEADFASLLQLLSQLAALNNFTIVEKEQSPRS